MEMMNETVLKTTIMRHLVKTYGHVDMERFISAVKRDPFDYTKWRGSQFDDMTADEVFDEMKAVEREWTAI
ncbi:MAG: hypothetical protein LBT74_07880 [Acidobacteriota bacterium]|jgi:hypothetical protein|nr:hypothetical protein [Acidobacteriota bacterium]